MNVLQKGTDSYNSSIHSSLGIEPVNAMYNNEKLLWRRIYISMQRIKLIKSGMKNILKVGDYVSISLLRDPFSREYGEKWSRDFFQRLQKICQEWNTCILALGLRG